MRVADGISRKLRSMLGWHRSNPMCSTSSFRRVALSFLCALAALVLCAVPAAVSAAPAGSITLECSVERDGVDVPLAGDRYEAVLVARASIDGDGVRHETLDVFASADCAWAELDAGGLRDKAREVHDLAVDAAVEPVGTLGTNASGVGAVYGLEPGIYLLYRTETAPANVDTTTDPFLVGVPTFVDGALTYNVTAHPKFEVEKPPAGGDPEPGAPGNPGNPGNPGGMFPGLDMPSTGDIQMMLVGLLLIAGVAVLWLSRRVSASGDASADEDAREQD